MPSCTPRRKRAVTIGVSGSSRQSKVAPAPEECAAGPPNVALCSWYRRSSPGCCRDAARAKDAARAASGVLARRRARDRHSGAGIPLDPTAAPVLSRLACQAPRQRETPRARATGNPRLRREEVCAMKAVVLRGAGDLRVEAIPNPVPGPGEVVLRVREVGICGSDLHFYHQDGGATVDASSPLILGHEFSAEIIEGGETPDLAPGRLVAVEPARPCGRCEWCLAGDPNLCQVQKLGSPARHHSHRPQGRAGSTATRRPGARSGVSPPSIISAENSCPRMSGDDASTVAPPSWW